MVSKGPLKPVLSEETPALHQNISIIKSRATGESSAGLYYVVKMDFKKSFLLSSILVYFSFLVLIVEIHIACNGNNDYQHRCYYCSHIHSSLSLTIDNPTNKVTNTATTIKA